MLILSILGRKATKYSYIHVITLLPCVCFLDVSCAAHTSRIVVCTSTFLDGKRPLGRPRVDNIKMNLREIGWDGMDWIDMTQDRDQWRALVNTVINVWVP
jgi:hypothetical protein